MLSRELIAASTKPIVLGILAKGASYGYEIIQQVKDLSDDQIEWAEGALYPVLHRLERKGLVESFWCVSDQGRRRKYYRLTQCGKAELIHERSQWQLASDLLNRLWLPQPQSA